MSDIMLLGILRMPFDLALSTPIAQIQYYQRGVQAADEIEKLRAEVDRLTDELDATRAEMERLRAEHRAEIERLRADIERIEDEAWHDGAKHGTSH